VSLHLHHAFRDACNLALSDPAGSEESRKLIGPDVRSGPDAEVSQAPR
jgi:hypothetical protein